MARRQGRTLGEGFGLGAALTHLDVGKKGVRGKGVAGERGVVFRRSDKDLGGPGWGKTGYLFLPSWGKVLTQKGQKDFDSDVSQAGSGTWRARL